MTQELANTSNVPDWANSRPPAGFEGLNPEESLGEGIGSSYPIIGYKGKIWSIRRQGQNHILVRPDDGTPIGYIDVVILRSPNNKAKSYYSGGYEENSSAGKRPTCASMDGVRPDPGVIEKQAELCGMCPRNEFYTDQNGRKTRDCSDYKRLAVLVMPDQTKRLFGEPLMEPAFLRVPAASLQKLLTFGDGMMKQNWHYSSFVTRISFDPTKSHPEFVFKAKVGLTPAEAPLILQLREDVTAKRITGEDEISRRERAVLDASAIRAPAGQTVPTVRQMITPPPVTAKVTAPPNPVVDLQSDTQGAFALEQPSAMVGQTAADVGTAVDDPELDKKIAAMLATT